MKRVSVTIIDGESTSLAAAVQLYHRGTTDIVILEREKKPGGILRQCVYDGFGLTRFKETLNGPEHTQRFMDMVDGMEAPYIMDTTILEVTPDKRVYAPPGEGMIELQAKTVILIMDYRERIRGTVSIPGEWSAGVYTAGVAQAYINLRNKMMGGEAVTLGLGDISAIMAGRLTLEGAHVRVVLEIQLCSGELPRSIEQCFRGYGTPLYLNHTMTGIPGKECLEGAVVSQMDGHMQPVPGSEKTYVCDTLTLLVGLIPENELSLGAGVILDDRSKGTVVDEDYQASVDGTFAAGNVLHVHDLVDFVSRETERLGDAAVEYMRKGGFSPCGLNIRTGKHITYTISQKINGNRSFCLSLRAKRPVNDCRIQVPQGDCVIKEQTFEKANPTEMIQITMDASVLNYREDVEVKVV